MRHFFLFLAASFFAVSAMAQTTLYEDDFEGYTAGDYVTTAGDWQTWSGGSGTSEDATISDAYNHTTDGANSMEIDANNDIVYMTGDQTSGIYQVKFWYYVPTGQGAYFNVQHDFGANWAFSAEMYDGGSGIITYDNPAVTVNYTFPQDQWFEIVLDIDMETDNVVVTIDGTEVGSWQFSLSESAGGPMLKLDCINFYGYADVTPPYYVDDFEFIEVLSGVEPPELELSETSFTSDGSANQTLTLTNSGEEEMTFEALVAYPESNPVFGQSTNNSSFENTNSKEVSLSLPGSKKLEKPIEVDLDTKDATITHLVSDVTSSLGWGGTDNTDAQAVALFKYDNNATAGVDLKDYIGMYVSNVILMFNDVPVSGSTEFQLFEGRDGFERGPMGSPVVTEDFTVTTAGEQVTVTLTTPYFVSGKDLFVGSAFTQLPDEHCIGMDDGPPADDANWTKTGVAWSEVVNADFGNFGIVVNLTGDPMHQWLTLDNTMGTISASGTQDITLQFDITDMVSGQYSSTLVIKTNDNDDSESYNELPVTLDVSVSVDDMERTAVMTYPNPAYDFLNVASFSEIKNVAVYNTAGQLVSEMNTSGTEVNMPISDLSAGVYFVKIKTVDQTVTRKFIVK